MTTTSRSRRNVRLRLFSPFIVYLLLATGSAVWLYKDLDGMALKAKQQIQEALGEDADPITPYTLRSARLGLIWIVGLGALAALVIPLISERLSRRRGEALLDVLKQALAGKDGEEEADGGGEAGLFDYAQRIGTALEEQRRSTAVRRAQMSRLAQLVDVGVLLFNSERQPELASACAQRLMGFTEDLPSEELTDRIFAAFGEPSEKPPNEAVARLDLETPQKIAELRLQLFRLDETCDHGYLVLVRDRKVLEAFETDLRLAAQLRGLSRLYLGLAHDLKAPLNAMSLNLELLNGSVSEQPGDDGEKARRWIAIVEEELHRLQRSLEGLLHQTAPGKQEAETYDLRQALAEIQALLAPQARLQKIELQMETPPEPVFVYGRRDLVKQAILNVAVNGLEAMPGEGRLRFELVLAESRSLLRIGDSGAGIPEEHLQHLFQMHFTTKEQGTGIGLYIARNILESEGGTLVLRETGVSRTTGESGTVFEASLPCVGGNESPREGESSASGPDRRRRTEHPDRPG